MKTYDTLVSNAFILSSNFKYQPFIGNVGIKDGHFRYVGDDEIDQDDCDEWIDGTDKILMPGLFNCHAHGDMTLARSMGDGMTLAEQNVAFEEHNWFYDFISDKDRYFSRVLTYIEALKSGTTFFVENMYWGLGDKSIKAMREVGIEGALIEDIRVNFRDSDTYLSQEELKSFKESCNAYGYVPVIGSISEEDFETKRLLKIEKMIEKEKFYKTMHLAENEWRVQLIEDKYQMTPVKYLSSIDVLNDRTLASHVDWVSDEEIQILADHNVKVVNTPMCEAKIADGVAPISKMIDRGIIVTLGTDGALWNNKNDIFQEMRMMMYLQSLNFGVRSLSPNDVLDMSTINGAKTFGIEQQYGSIEVGKKASFILIETMNAHMRPLRIGKHSNIASLVVFNASGQDVSDVFVSGNHVVKNGEIQTINEKEVIKFNDGVSNHIADKILERK